MSFLSANEVKGVTHAIIVGLYSDKITATAVRRENNAFAVAASVLEPMGGFAAQDGALPVDIVMFNVEKALLALPAAVRAPATPVIVVLGSGTGMFTYALVRGKRDAREKKITQEEMTAMIDAVNTEKGNTVIAKNFPEHFSIDGFSVSDPVGVNGQEVSVGVVRIACDTAFEKTCTERIGSLGLRCAGFADMRFAALRGDQFFIKGPNALLVFVFEHETYAVLMREKAVHGVGVTRTGYGILYAEGTRTFAVGYEEAKAIVRAYRKGELDDATKATVEAMIAGAAQKVADAARDTIVRIDLANIIPGNIHIVCADGVPEVPARFIVGDWFANLPIERNAAVSVVPEEKDSGYQTPFDRMTAEFLLGHH